MRVPTVEGPSAAPEALPGARYAASPAAGAGALLQAQRLSEAAQAAQQFAQQYQTKRDLRDSWAAETALKDGYREFEQSESAKLGIEADGATKRGSQWWEDARSRFSEGLNDRANFAFQRTFEQLRLASLESLGRHEQQQTNRAVAETAQARVGSAINFATADPTPQRIELARKDIIEAGNISGKLAGMPQEVIAARVGDGLTLLHKGVVERYLEASQPDQARSYYDANRGEINGQTQLVIEHTLKQGGLVLKAQETADHLMPLGLPLDEAMRRIEKDLSGEEERAAKVELASRYAYTEAAKKQMDMENYGQAQLEVEQGGRVSPVTWAKLTPTHQAAILNRQQAEARQRRLEAQGLPVKTDWGLYLSLREQADQQPGKFLETDLKQYVDKIGPGQMEQLLDLRTRLAKPAKEPRDAVSLTQQMSARLKDVGIKSEKAKGAFMSYVQEEVSAAQDAKGKPLSFEERQVIIDKALLKGPDPDRFLPWGERFFFQLTPEQRPRFQPNATTDAPASEADALNEALKQQGLPQTPANRLALYNRTLNKGGQ
jgi:hypothetical protein